MRVKASAAMVVSSRASGKNPEEGGFAVFTQSDGEDLGGEDGKEEEG